MSQPRDGVCVSDHSVAIIGTGDPSGDGFAMAYHHAEGYKQIDGCELVACADVLEENADRFAEAFDLGTDGAFVDHGEMVATVEPDIVSVCVPPAIHAELVVDCARAGVGAIHCEKPMARTWEESKRMVATCEEAGTMLTFNHQRRFAPPWQRAKELLEEGAIGELERIEMAAGDFYDWGTHIVDLGGYFTDEQPAEWVIGQVDGREERELFGAPVDNQTLAQWEYENGVDALAATGDGAEIVDCRHRLLGSGGTIEVRRTDAADLRIKRDGETEWTGSEYDYEWTDAIHTAIEDIVDSYAQGEESLLNGANALRATEIIFAAYESARGRGRVDLPLDIEDNPYEAMVDSGALVVENDRE